jgi:hypothetical protein
MSRLIPSSILSTASTPGTEHPWQILQAEFRSIATEFLALRALAV